MTQYNTLNVELSSLQLNKLKSGIKNGAGVTLKLSSNVVGDSNDENNFPHKLFLTGLPLMKNVLKPLAKSILIPLGLTAAVSATDTAMHKKYFGSGNTKLIISNEEMNDIMKIIQSLEESVLLIKSVSKTIKN